MKGMFIVIHLYILISELLTYRTNVGIVCQQAPVVQMQMMIMKKCSEG